jgi:hypothetical protein
LAAEKARRRKKRMGTMGEGGANYEFANEVAGLGANPAGQAKTGVGRTNQRTTASLRGKYGGR